MTPERYLAIYNDPSYSIRKWNEEHGIITRVGSNGMIYQSIAPEDFQEHFQQAKSIMPEYFQDRLFDDFITGMYTGSNRTTAEMALKTTKSFVRRYAEIVERMSGRGLYLYSKTRGSGKTFLSTIVGNELSRKGVRVRWYSMLHLLNEIKNTYDKDSGTSQAEVIGKAEDAQCLILDDIGAEKQSGWVDEIVYQIVDKRLMHGKPLIVTSNLQIDELKYDERIKDRLRKATYFVQMPEESIRSKLARIQDKDMNDFYKEED